jgi:hypothetical protein
VPAFVRKKEDFQKNKEMDCLVSGEVIHPIGKVTALL